MYLCVYCCSVTKSCLILCNHMDCSIPGFPVLHYLLEFAQTPVHWVGDAIQPSYPLSPLLLLPSIFSSIRVFSMSWLFASGGQSFGASASTSAAKVLELQLQHQSFHWIFVVDFPQDWLISLLSKGLSGVFASTTVWKHQFSNAQHYLWFNSHINM